MLGVGVLPALLSYVSPLFRKNNLLFRIMDPLKHKSPICLT